MLARELADRAVPIGLPEGPQVHVLDASHVEAVVHADPPVERVGVQAADIVPARYAGAEVHRLVGVDHQNIDDRAVVIPGGNSPRIGHGWVRACLIGIEDHQAPQGRVPAQRDEGRPLGLVRAAHRHDDAPAQQRIGEGVVVRVVCPHSHRRPPRALQCHVRWNRELALHAVLAHRDLHNPAARSETRVHRGLKGGRVVSRAVAHGSVVGDRERRGEGSEC